MDVGSSSGRVRSDMVSYNTKILIALCYWGFGSGLADDDDDDDNDVDT